MNVDDIQRVLADISADTDPAIKHLKGEVETDWMEVKRLAENSAYRNWNDVKALIYEQAQALQIRSPYDTNE